MHQTTMLDLPAVLALAVLGLGVGCVVQADDTDPFATAAAPNPPATPTSGGSSSGSGTGGSSGEPGSSGEGVDTTAAMTTAPMGSTSTTGTDESTSSDGGGMGMQPAMGMYADCTVAACSGLANVCLTITENDIDLGAFCTAQGCANPALDCDPSPGGTATPVCLDATVNGMPDSLCALSCAGGATCPAPMICAPLSQLCV